MANLLRGGFRPRWPGRGRGPRRYEVASGYGTALFPGDVVTLLTDGTVAACTAGGAPLILGAVSACSYIANGVRTLGYIPANTTYTPTTRGSATASYCWVWDEPGIEYIAPVASNAGTNTAALVYAALGSNMDILATAGDTVYKRSGFTLDGNPIAGTAQFRISEVLRDPAQDLSSANFRVVCVINKGFHPFDSQAGI